MHLPDKLLGPEVWIPLCGVSAATVGICAHRAKAHLADRSIPLVGVMGAFVFALQMINFPIAAGVSDHIIGAALLAIVFGPSIAVLAMAAIIVIQALLFGDGGITALGANIFDMAIVPVFAAWAIYGVLRRVQHEAAVAAATVAAVLLGAAAAAGWVMLSQPYGATFFAAMMLMHCVSGGVEAFVTVAVIGALRRSGLMRTFELGMADA
jgi:cobalt/nickel transport system permease protein